MRAVNYHREARSILDVCEGPVYVSVSYDTQTASRTQKSFTNFVCNSFENILCSKKKKEEEEKTWYFASKGSVWVLVQLQSKSLRNADFAWPAFSRIRTVSSILVFLKILYNDQFTRQKSSPQSWRLQLLMNRVFFKSWMFWQDTRQNWNWL